METGTRPFVEYDETVSTRDMAQALVIVDTAERHQNFVPLERLAERKGFAVERQAAVMGTERLHQGEWHRVGPDMTLWTYSCGRIIDNPATNDIDIRLAGVVVLDAVVAFLHSQPDAPSDEDPSELAPVS